MKKIPFHEWQKSLKIMKGWLEDAENGPPPSFVSSSPFCPVCQSDKICKNGKSKVKLGQAYKCLNPDCGKFFYIPED